MAGSSMTSCCVLRFGEGGRCRHPRPVPDGRTGKSKMKACGRPKCSRQCRDLWAWKHALCAARSFQVLPPSHFLVLRPKSSVPESAFATAISAAMRKLGRRRGERLMYFRIFEWSRGRIHAHLLIRTHSPLAGQEVRSVFGSTRSSGYAVTCQPVRKCAAALARYVFKDMMKEKAELPPPDFRGKLFAASHGFFTMPIPQLWGAVKVGWTARSDAGPSASSGGLMALHRRITEGGLARHLTCTGAG